MKLKMYLMIFSIVALISLLLAMTAYGAISINKTVPSSGRIVVVNVGIYSDSGCTQTISSLDWGSLKPGDIANNTLYVKNNGKSNITLSMAVNGWSPTNASQWITLGWNQNNKILAANQTAMAILTLTISPSIDPSIDTFSSNITITGTG